MCGVAFYAITFVLNMVAIIKGLSWKSRMIF